MKINLYGELVSDEWAWIYEFFEIPHCCPRQVREAIAGLAPDEELVIEVNCPGGSVWAGFEIFGLLQACRAHTEAHIIAMAASAATTVTSACETVLASPVAQIMIHQPAARAGYLDNDGARQLVNFLDSVRASVINSYVIKAAGKTPRARFEQLVSESTWMPAQDAIDLGLVDGILDADEESAQRIREAGGVLVSNMASLSPAPADLLRRYEAAVRAGTAQEVPGHPVRPKAQEEAGNGAEEAREGQCGKVCDSSENGPPRASAPTEKDESGNDGWRMQAAIDLERARCAL